MRNKFLYIRLRHPLKPVKAYPILQEFITNHPPVKPVKRSIFYAKYSPEYMHRTRIAMTAESLYKLHGIAAARHQSTSFLASAVLENNFPDLKPPPNSKPCEPVSSEGIIPPHIVSEEDKPSSRKDSLADLSVEQHAYRHDGTLSGYLGILAIILQDEITFRETYGKSPLSHSAVRMVWEEKVGYNGLTVDERLQLFFGPGVSL